MEFYLNLIQEPNVLYHKIAPNFDPFHKWVLPVWILSDSNVHLTTKKQIGILQRRFSQDLHCEYQVALCLAIWELSSIKWSVKFCMWLHTIYSLRIHYLLENQVLIHLAMLRLYCLCFLILPSPCARRSKM